MISQSPSHRAVARPTACTLGGVVAYAVALALLLLTAPGTTGGEPGTATGEDRTGRAAVITGRIAWPSGRPLRGAGVTAISTSTGAEFATTVDLDGRYRLPVPPGVYVLVARSELFGSYRFSTDADDRHLPVTGVVTVSYVVDSGAASPADRPLRGRALRVLDAVALIHSYL